MYLIIKNYDQRPGQTLFSDSSSERLYHIYPDKEANYGVKVIRDRWHERLGHPLKLKSIILESQITTQGEKKDELCSVWPLAKVH